MGGIVLFLTATIVVCFVVARRPTAKTLSDSDLVPERLPLPAESNAFWTFLEVTNALYWPDSLADKLDDLSNSRNWDDSLAADVLERNHDCSAWFDQSFQRQLQVPMEATVPEKEYSYLWSLRYLSKLQCVRAAKFFHDRKEKEAFDLALKIVEFGHRLEDSGGDSMHYLVGSSIKTFGLRRIRDMTAQTTLEDTELVRIIRSLDQFGPNKPGLTNALKVEYQIHSALLDEIATGNLERLGITNPASAQLSVSNEMKRAFNPDKTRGTFAGMTRTLLKSIPQPFCQTAWPEFSKARTVGLAWLQWALLKNHNATGDLFFYAQLSSVKKVFERKCREDVNVRSTQVLVALKIFAKRHRQLPASLADLTPEPLSQIPMDDFDGKSLRYSPSKKLIYSVGPDLQDSGGVGSSGGDDLAFEVKF